LYRSYLKIFENESFGVWLLLPLPDDVTGGGGEGCW
jgi:hypothetical protein